IPSPVLVFGGTGPVRTLALARLGAESVEAGARILWVGAPRAVWPLAHLPLREERLDARPTRADLGDSPWPALNPFALEPGLSAEWLAYAVGESEPSERRRLAAALSHVLADWSVGRAPWTPPSPEQALAMLSLRLPRLLERLVARGRLPRSTSGRVPFVAGSAQMTVVVGHVDDLVARESEIVLVILSFLTRALARPTEPHLVVIEDWVDRISPDARDLMAATLLDACRLAPGLEVLVASATAAEWQTPSALAFVDTATALVAQSNVAWPACWLAPALPVGLPPLDVSVIYALDRAIGGSTWRAYRLPAPAIPADDAAEVAP
ncbi:MAG TPA: hypothetical protein VF178_02820, partial [Gemmatimonadaceae bacterium]